MSPMVIAYTAVQYLANVPAAAHGCSFASDTGGVAFDAAAVALELLAAFSTGACGVEVVGVCDCNAARAVWADVR